MRFFFVFEFSHRGKNIQNIASLRRSLTNLLKETVKGLGYKKKVRQAVFLF